MKEFKLGEILDKVLTEQGYTRETYTPGIVYIGFRPGEKLTEELMWPNE